MPSLSWPSPWWEDKCLSLLDNVSLSTHKSWYYSRYIYLYYISRTLRIFILFQFFRFISSPIVLSIYPLTFLLVPCQCNQRNIYSGPQTVTWLLIPQIYVFIFIFVVAKVSKKSQALVQWIKVCYTFLYQLWRHIRERESYYIIMTSYYPSLYAYVHLNVIIHGASL